MKIINKVMKSTAAQRRATAKWNAKNKDKVAAYQKKWRDANKEKIKAKRKKYLNANERHELILKNRKNK